MHWRPYIEIIMKMRDINFICAVSSSNDDDDGYPLECKFIGFYATWGQWRAEAVGCPGQRRFLDALENILYSSRKISDDPFRRSPKFFTFFASVVKFHENSLLGCPQCCIMSR